MKKSSNTTGLELQAFDFEESAVRVVALDDEPWFVAADVCRAIGIANSRDAVARLDADERNTVGLSDGIRGNPNKVIINESGLYTLILRCDDAIKPGTTAHRFRKWVTGEVLPALRKEGAYALAQIAQREDAEARLNDLRADISLRVRGIETRAGYVADQSLCGMPMSRVNADARLARVQLDACRFLWELETGGRVETAAAATSNDQMAGEEDGE